MACYRRVTTVQVAALVVGMLLGLLVSLPDINISQQRAHTPKSETKHNVYIRRRIIVVRPPPPIKDKTGPVDPNEGIIMSNKPASNVPKMPAVGPKRPPFKVDESKLGEVIINPHDYYYNIDPTDACADKDLFLVAYIHTAPDHLDRRNIVRKTWAKHSLYKDTKIRVLFMMGQATEPGLQEAIEEEAEKYHDIIQESFVDAYHNLSIKAVGAMRWVTSRCKQVKFILKTDDDVFVNLFGLLPHLRDLDTYNVNNTGLLMCLVWYKMHVLRDGKWKIPESIIAGEFYPHYCSGMAYIMTPDVAEAIYRTSSHVPFFWVDDVYITGMIPKAMGLKHVDISRLFFGRNEVDWLLSGDDWHKYLFSHLRDTEHYMAMWEILKDKGLKLTIPKMTEIVAGKLATKYGPKKPPESFMKELEKKKRRQKTRVKIPDNVKNNAAKKN